VTDPSLCGQCLQPLPPEATSLYFCDWWHQKRWYVARLASDADRRIAEPGLVNGMTWSVQ
jgi:hypothetical protein